MALQMAFQAHQSRQRGLWDDLAVWAVTRCRRRSTSMATLCL